MQNMHVFRLQVHIREAGYFLDGQGLPKDRTQDLPLESSFQWACRTDARVCTVNGEDVRAATLGRVQ